MRLATIGSSTLGICRHACNRVRKPDSMLHRVKTAAFSTCAQPHAGKQALISARSACMAGGAHQKGRSPGLASWKVSGIPGAMLRLG